VVMAARAPKILNVSLLILAHAHLELVPTLDALRAFINLLVVVALLILNVRPAIAPPLACTNSALTQAPVLRATPLALTP